MLVFLNYWGAMFWWPLCIGSVERLVFAMFVSIHSNMAIDKQRTILFSTADVPASGVLTR